MQESGGTGKTLHLLAMVKSMQGIHLPSLQSAGWLGGALQPRGAEGHNENREKEICRQDIGHAFKVPELGPSGQHFQEELKVVSSSERNDLKILPLSSTMPGDPGDTSEDLCMPSTVSRGGPSFHRSAW